MKSITLRSHVGADGQLQLNIPTDLMEMDLEITIFLRPLAPKDRQSEKFSEWWSKRLAKFPNMAAKVAERDLRYEYLAERYKFSRSHAPAWERKRTEPQVTVG